MGKKVTDGKAAMARIDRVREMEERFDKVRGAVEKVMEGLEELEGLGEEIRALNEYQASGLWLKDFEADEAGKIPSGLKRGVLSEDGLFNLLGDVDKILEAFPAISNIQDNQ